MKDNKNLVFGLTSFTQKADKSFVKDGYLLFPDEEKALNFLTLCENMNRNEKSVQYEKFSWVKVDKFVGERVHEQKHFFVSQAEAYTPTEEDFKPKASKSVDIPVEEAADIEE